LSLSGLIEDHPIHKRYKRLRSLQLFREPPPAVCQIEEYLSARQGAQLLRDLFTMTGVFATFFGITRHGSGLQFLQAGDLKLSGTS
jgi:hypothetical protein